MPNHSSTIKLLVLPRCFLPPSNLAPSLEASKKRGTLLAAQDLATKQAKGARPPVNIRTLSTVLDQGVNASASHPLLNLQASQTIKLIGSRPTEKYSVTRIKNLSDSRSSSV